jgi:hypothetical protein
MIRVIDYIDSTTGMGLGDIRDLMKKAMESGRKVAVVECQRGRALVVYEGEEDAEGEMGQVLGEEWGQVCGAMAPWGTGTGTFRSCVEKAGHGTPHKDRRGLTWTWGGGCGEGEVRDRWGGGCFAQNRQNRGYL